MPRSSSNRPRFRNPNHPATPPPARPCSPPTASTSSMILLCFFLETSTSQFVPYSDTDTLPKIHTTPCLSPSTADSAPPSSPTQLLLPSPLLHKATSRPPNPVVGSGWPGSGAGFSSPRQPPAVEPAKC